MAHKIIVESVAPQLIAAVTVSVRLGEIAGAWKPALDQVWAFLRDANLGPTHNLFLYHHPQNRNDPMAIDFGVQVARRFADAGNVRCIETPAGMTASTLHVGPYDRLAEAHNAIHSWARDKGQGIGAFSWETYGDWNDDPSKLETTVSYLLA